MAGIVAKIAMQYMLKSKENREHYVPRDYVAAREQQNKMTSLQPLPKNITKTKDELGFWFENNSTDRSKIWVYIHGGGFNIGSAEYAFNTPVMLCKNGGYPVFSIDYRLAPESPYPAALNDCVAAYKKLLERGFKGKDMVFVGDSAGGNLVFAVALYLKDHCIELPAGICGISPVGTLDDTPPSRRERVARDPMICADFTEEMEAIYVKGNDVTSPYISPVYGDFSGMPPIWMCVGTEEVFYDDAFMLKAAAEKAGTAVELIIGKGLCHVYPAIPDPQSTKAIKSMRKFADKVFSV